jgi:hypothetical protein
VTVSWLGWLFKASSADFAESTWTAPCMFKLSIPWSKGSDTLTFLEETAVKKSAILVEIAQVPATLGRCNSIEVRNNISKAPRKKERGVSRKFALAVVSFDQNAKGRVVRSRS